MKNLAKLALFFSLSFAILFIAGAGFRFLALRIQWMRNLLQEPETILTVLITSAHWALSFTLYSSLLLSLSYAARRKNFQPSVFICLIVLSLGFTYGVSLGLEHWSYVEPAQNAASAPLGEAGLILNQTSTSVVLLKGPQDLRGPRVTAISDQPLLYQAEPVGPNSAILSLPPLSLGNETPWFLSSIAIDLKLSAEQIELHFDRGLVPFLVYTGALIFLLCSLGFVLKLSAWPLANIFLGCLVFRGILVLETFFNSPEMQDVFESFLKGRISPLLTIPLIFCGFGLLVNIYSILVFLAKRQIHEED